MELKAVQGVLQERRQEAWHERFAPEPDTFRYAPSGPVPGSSVPGLTSAEHPAATSDSPSVGCRREANVYANSNRHARSIAVAGGTRESPGASHMIAMVSFF